MTKSLRLYFGHSSWTLFLSMIPPKETLIPSYESLVNLGNLFPSGEVMCSPAGEHISPSSEVLDISSGTSIKASEKTCD